MAGDRSEWLKKVTGVAPPANDAGTAPDAAGDGAYRAFLAEKGPRQAVRLRFTLASGETWTVSYGHVAYTQFLPPDVLGIFTATHQITIEGRGLDVLDDMLADEKCRSIETFRPGVHQPPDRAEPLVEKITVQGLFAADTPNPEKG